MKTLPPVVRRATPADSEQIAALMRQLGYQVTAAQTVKRLISMQDSSADLVLVASRDERIVGSISLHLLPLFHADGFLGRITSLVIDEAHRGQRIGSALMHAASDWFVANGCVKIEVTSGDHRPDAHRFYEAHGLSRDGQRLAKMVTVAR